MRLTEINRLSRAPTPHSFRSAQGEEQKTEDQDLLQKTGDVWELQGNGRNKLHSTGVEGRSTHCAHACDVSAQLAKAHLGYKISPDWKEKKPWEARLCVVIGHGITSTGIDGAAQCVLTRTGSQMEAMTKLIQAPFCVCVSSAHRECAWRMRCCTLGSRVGK